VIDGGVESRTPFDAGHANFAGTRGGPGKSRATRGNSRTGRRLPASDL